MNKRENFWRIWVSRYFDSLGTTLLLNKTQVVLNDKMLNILRSKLKGAMYKTQCQLDKDKSLLRKPPISIFFGILIKWHLLTLNLTIFYVFSCIFVLTIVQTHGFTNIHHFLIWGK